MHTLRIPDINTTPSILQVTGESGKAVLKIRKLPQRVLAVVAEMDGEDSYKIREDPDECHVAIVDLEMKKEVEKSIGRLGRAGYSQNFTCTIEGRGNLQAVGRRITAKDRTLTAEIKGDQLQVITDYENHALLVAVYIIGKKLPNLYCDQDVEYENDACVTFCEYLGSDGSAHYT